MRSVKGILGAVVLLGALASTAQAQQFGVGGFGGNAFGNNFGGYGFNNFGYNNGFGGVNYGSAYAGAYGYSNGVLPYYQAPRTTYNNLGGLANAITTHTGKANSYRYGYGQVPTFRRR